MSHQWKEVKDVKSGRLYYYNKVTKETTWTAPAELATKLDVQSSKEDDSDVAVNEFLKSTSWRRAKRDDGRAYYYEKASQAVQWEPPQILVDFLAARDALKKSSTDADSSFISANKRSGEPIAQIGKRVAREEDVSDDEYFGRDEDEGNLAEAAADDVHHEADGYGHTNNEYVDTHAEEDIYAHDGTIQVDTTPLYSYGGDEGLAREEDSPASAVEQLQDPQDLSESIKLTKEQCIAQLETQLSSRDIALEPIAITLAKDYYALTADGPKLADRLTRSYRGAAQLAAIVGNWLTLAQTLRATSETVDVNKEKDKSKGKGRDSTEEVVTQILCKVAKQHFSTSAADALLLQNGRPAFMTGLLDDPLSRRMLLELYNEHGQSHLLGWCVREMHAAGHHEEISAVIRESDYLEVFIYQLLNILGRLQSLANEAIVAGTQESNQPKESIAAIATSLRRACCSAEYTYIFTCKLLLFLEARLANSTGLSPLMSSRCQRLQAWVRRLRWELESSVVWDKPTQGENNAGSSTPASITVLDNAALFTVKMGGLYVRRIGSADGDTLSRVMYECLDSIRLRDISPGHAERLLRLLLVMPDTPSSTDVDTILTITVQQLQNIPIPLYYIRHAELLRCLAMALSSRKFPEKQNPRYAMLLALAACGGPADDLPSLGWASACLPRAGQLDTDPESCVLAVNSVAAALVEAASLARQVSIAASQHSAISADRARRLPELARKAPVVAAVLLQWGQSTVQDSSLTERETSLQQLPIVMQIVVEAATLYPAQHVMCYGVLAGVLALPMPSTKQDAANDRYTVQAARRDAWEALISLLCCGFCGPPLQLLRQSLPTMDADLVRHVLRLLLHAVKPPLSRPFARALSSMLAHAAVEKALRSEHFAVADTSNLQILQKIINERLADTTRMDVDGEEELF